MLNNYPVKNRKILETKFYQRPTIKVAKELLGKKLCRKLPNGEIISGLIVETEAYLGVIDEACHSYKHKKTPRTMVMYECGGISYVYFIYGMYYCFNVVTSKKEHPEAVLIRALQPMDGIELMKLKSQQTNISKILNGPGKICKVFEIDKSLNGHDLTKSPLWIEDAMKVPTRQICKSKRINIGTEGEWVDKPLRFSIKDTPYISVKLN